MYINGRMFLKYFLFLALLAVSGFEYFFRVDAEMLYLFFPMIIGLFIYYKKRFDWLVILYIVPFALVFVLQHLHYGGPLYFALTIAVRLSTVYAMAKIIGKDIIKIFINSIVVIAMISLPLYFLQYLDSTRNLMYGFTEFFVNLKSDPAIIADRPNFIIYTLQSDLIEGFGLYRNSGPFWEPGLFVVFLNIGLFLNMMITNKIFNRINLILIVSIITTFSTSGFAVLMLSLTVFTFLNNSLSSFYKFTLTIILIILVPLVISLPFMQSKIEGQIEDSDLSYSRFGAAIVHWNIMQDFPVTGMPNSTSIYEKYADNISPNGVTEIFIRYGVIFGLFYYILLFRACVVFMKFIGRNKLGLPFFAVVVISIFGETIGTSPIYWALIFSQIPICIYLKKVNNHYKTKQLIVVN